MSEDDVISVGVVGSPEFLKRLESAGKPKETTPEEEELKQLAVTISPSGELLGDTSHLPVHILSQLQTPEAKKMMREQYRTSRYEPEPPRPIRYVNEREDRDFSKQKPPGMSSNDFRHLRRKVLHKMTKRALRVQRSLRNGQ